MRLIALCLLLLVTSCRQQQQQPPPPPATSGAALEQAALKSGAIHSGSDTDAAGRFEGEHGSGGDRLCLTPSGEGYRATLELALDEKQTCAGEGTARRAGETLVFAFGRCTLVADYDGDRIAFPGAVDRSCERLCTGRASMAGVGFVRTDGDCQD